MNKSPKRENPLVSLVFNIVLPVVLLTKFSQNDYVSPIVILLISLSFPLFFGLLDFYNRSKFNWISLIGVLSVLYMGVVGLMKLSPEWVAVKEAAVPALIGLAVVVSIFINKPLIRKFLLNDTIFNTSIINEKVHASGKNLEFELFLKRQTWLLALTFFFSAVLNYILAKMIVVSQAGSVAFNEELGRLTALSYPVIALPSTAMLMLILWFVLRRLKMLTGLTLEQVMLDGKS